jgi:hypothetical protein
MNRTLVSVALGLAATVFAGLAVRAVRPAPPSIAALHRRIQPTRASVTASGVAAGAAGRRPRWAERIARSGVGGRLAERFAADLLVAEATVPAFVTQLAVAATVGFVVTTAAVGSLVAVGARVAPAFAALAALGGAAAGVALAVTQLRARGARARAEFRTAVSQYLTLCSSVMAGGRSAEWAVRYAAGAGSGRAFETIDAALRAAPAMGRTTWDALAAVATDWAMPELGDLAAAIERATTLGGDAADAAGVIAQAMRARSLDAVERAADRANVKMLGPTYLFLAGFGLFLAFPLLDELSSSF